MEPLDKNLVESDWSEVPEVSPGVLEVGDVGGDDGATGGAGDDTADSEPCGAVAVSTAPSRGALRGGEAGSVDTEHVQLTIDMKALSCLASEKAVQALFPNWTMEKSENCPGQIR